MSNNNSNPPHSEKSLFRSTSILAAGTLSSRILGFLRNIVLAKLFGTGFNADVFFLALRIPNLFRDLVGEGAANSAVVPVLSEYQVKGDKKDLWRLVSAISLWAMIILSAITVLGVIFAPAIVHLMAPGFAAEPAKTKLAVELTRLMFPYLILIGLTAHSMAVLATFRSFTSAAFSPCLFNIAVIASAFCTKYFSEPTYALAYGVLAGGVLQLAAQIPSMLKHGMRLEMTPLSHPGAQQAGKLLLPRLVGSGVYQLNLVIDTICASLINIVGPGGISAIFYSNQLIQLPLGVFGFAMATAALPALSTMAAQNDIEKFKRTVSASLENIFFIMFPTTVVMVLLSEPLVRVLFERGAFDAYSTTVTSLALTFFTLGLFSFGGTKILTMSFYALKDTKTPVKIAAGNLALNTALNIVLMGPMKIGGIALASSISSAVGFFALFYFLEKRIGVMSEELVTSVTKILAASTGAAIVILVLIKISAGWDIPELVKLALMGSAGYFVYGAACVLLKVAQAQRIMKVFIKNG
ncbi:MAG: murein biosynthesis integral membrane protein MurJ [Candidatus Omnitrophica bacterium]|nr:murein biosynthesis integral membrane protein MurJ [Candidatus Omnitrophota bacterium]